MTTVNFHLYSEEIGQEVIYKDLCLKTNSLIGQQYRLYIYSDQEHLSLIDKALYTTVQQSFIEHEYDTSKDRELARVILTSFATAQKERDCIIQFIPEGNNLAVVPPAISQRIEIFSKTNEQQKSICKEYLAEFKKRNYKIHSTLQ